MSMLQNISLVIMLLNIFLAITVIFLERRNASSTWAWLMILFFIPVVGFILYLILGQKVRRRQLNKLLGDNQRIIEETLDKQKQQVIEKKLLPPNSEQAHYQDMIYMNLTTGYALYTNNNTVDIYTDGHQKFDTLIRDIEAAKHHVHLVYYIVRDDVLGRRLVKALAAKAAEGVEVRFLYDHIGSSKLPSRYFRELREAGGMEAAFFPSRIPYVNLKINYRNHRKLVIIDGNVGYIGGFNIGDEYLGLDKNFGEWRDTHLKVKGSAVLQMQAQFLMDWNLASSGRLDLNSTYFPEMVVDEGNIGMQLVASGPDTEYQEIKNAYIKMIYSAKETICLQTPYFVPDESLMTALRIAALSGVNVRIMLPSKPDHFFVYWATHSYLGEMLTSGVQIFLYERGFLHAKTLVVDSKIATVGTTNIDIRSFKLNFEMNAFIYDTETATRLMTIFEHDVTHSRQLSMEDYENRPMFNRFKESISRLLSPIL
ncbi:cardiolipin synthase [Paenibacillus sp. GSMTC-2017]|uniref:cardiolipin synthase n=1 Tax=Paenibacillus sp. GSMTC-2017 TaxID=2794350 RepID=UPI0018D61831|nr:cardiolipin synthase [Paenibacillus sp. GSMTC-2017]MBH5319815.1 cardiolipin synthase [Paenibacillus sp. GSMTC-2017]